MKILIWCIILFSVVHSGTQKEFLESELKRMTGRYIVEKKYIPGNFEINVADTRYVTKKGYILTHGMYTYIIFEGKRIFGSSFIDEHTIFAIGDVRIIPMND